MVDHSKNLQRANEKGAKGAETASLLDRTAVTSLDPEVRHREQEENDAFNNSFNSARKQM